MDLFKLELGAYVLRSTGDRRVLERIDENGERVAAFSLSKDESRKQMLRESFADCGANLPSKGHEEIMREAFERTVFDHGATKEEKHPDADFREMLKLRLDTAMIKLGIKSNEPDVIDDIARQMRNVDAIYERMELKKHMELHEEKAGIQELSNDMIQGVIADFNAMVGEAGAMSDFWNLIQMRLFQFRIEVGIDPKSDGVIEYIKKATDCREKTIEKYKPKDAKLKKQSPPEK